MHYCRRKPLRCYVGPHVHHDNQRRPMSCNTNNACTIISVGDCQAKSGICKPCIIILIDHTLVREGDDIAITSSAKPHYILVQKGYSKPIIERVIAFTFTVSFELSALVIFSIDEFDISFGRWHLANKGRLQQEICGLQTLSKCFD